VEKIAYLRLFIFVIFDILIGESITSDIFLHRRVEFKIKYRKNTLFKIKDSSVN
jgi:hypothetical protein